MENGAQDLLEMIDADEGGWAESTNHTMRRAEESYEIKEQKNDWSQNWQI